MNLKIKKKIHRFFSMNVYLLLLVVSLASVSCSDDDNSTSDEGITDAEVQELLKSSLVDQGGLIDDLQITATNLYESSSDRPAPSVDNAKSLSLANCNQAVSVTYQNSNTIGNRSWSILTNWEWTLNCDNDSNTISFTLDGAGTLDFDGPNLSKDITKTHAFLITGIEPSSDFWLYNASHTREGLVQMNVGNQNSFTTSLTYGSTDVVISKATQQIESGTFEIQLVVTTLNGNTITRGATLVFNGNQTGTVTFNNGNSFEISW